MRLRQHEVNVGIWLRNTLDDIAILNVPGATVSVHALLHACG